MWESGSCRLESSSTCREGDAPQPHEARSSCAWGPPSTYPARLYPAVDRRRIEATDPASSVPSSHPLLSGKRRNGNLPSPEFCDLLQRMRRFQKGLLGIPFGATLDGGCGSPRDLPHLSAASEAGGSLVGLSPSLWDVTLTPGRWCEH